MKPLLFLGALLVVFSSALLTVSSIALGQTMWMSPDTAAQGTQLHVTIVGIGTRFSNSTNVSYVGVILERPGSSVQSSGASLVNDSTISASISIGSQMPTGIYNLIVDVVDTQQRQFTQDSAFRVTAGLPFIASVSPSSAYDSETVSVQIAGGNTDFLTGSVPTISFLRNGTTYFTAQSDTVHTNTTIGASVFVPANAPAGNYDVIVTNASYSDTGRQKFSVLGIAPTSVQSAMQMIPDSGSQQQQLSITIVGNGTHFTTTQNVSMLSVKLERNGNLYDQATSPSFVNDSTIHASLQVSQSMQIGSYYDLVVEVNNGSLHTYTRDSAFHVVAPAPSIISVSPSSAYDSQTVAVQITGQSTNFQNGPSPTVFFERNGTTYFSAQSDTVLSNTSIGASVTVPAGTAAATYDIVIQNGTYSDTGNNKFTVLGPIPTVEIIPDSGAQSTEFGVTIVGQNTNFSPTSTISQSLPMNIDLEMGGVSMYHITADTVFSTTRATAIFSLPDSLAQGMYDAEIHGSTYTGPSFDYHTSFLVTHHPIIIPGNHDAPRADTVTIGLHGSGVHFIAGTQYVKTVQLIEEDPVTITASTVTVTSDTSLSAFFTIPAQAPAGLYDIAIVEPGTNRTVIAPNAFTIDSSTAGVDNNPVAGSIHSLRVSPNPMQDNVSISFSMGAPSHVHLWLFDALGHSVATLCDRYLATGEQSFLWSATDLPSGCYFYELNTGEEVYSGQIVVRH